MQKHLVNTTTDNDKQKGSHKYTNLKGCRLVSFYPNCLSELKVVQCEKLQSTLTKYTSDMKGHMLMPRK